MSTKQTGLRPLLISVVLILLPVVIALGSLQVGRYPVGIDELGAAISAKLSGETMSPAHLAILEVRLPRIIVGLAVGAGLAVSGAVFQGLFRNPVVSPNILGATSGASFGAAAAILMGASAVGIQSMAFGVGLAAVGLVALMHRIVGRGLNSTVTLILCGMLVSSLFSALTSLTQFLADTETQLPAITFWLMGSLASIRMSDASVLWVFVPVIVALLIFRWKLNVLAMGEDEARMMGVHTTIYRWGFVAGATLLASQAVSVAGNIGWVGLVVPHFARLLVGASYHRVLPASALLGAAFMVGVDTVARNLLTVEIPLGILTAMIGAPFFFLLLLRGKRGFPQ